MILFYDLLDINKIYKIACVIIVVLIVFRMALAFVVLFAVRKINLKTPAFFSIL